MGARGATGYVLGRGAGSAAAWWMAAGVTPTAAYAPKGAASLAASYVNLANPGTYNAAPGVAPTWSAATGWTFNGTTQYLVPGVVPAAGWSVIVKFADAATAINDSGRIVIGSQSAISTRLYIRVSVSLGGEKQHTFGYGAGGVSAAPEYLSGTLANCAGNGYYNGSLVRSATTTWSGTATNGLVIGAHNTGVIGFYFGGKIQALAIYAATLSAAQVAAVTAAMNLL